MHDRGFRPPIAFHTNILTIFPAIQPWSLPKLPLLFEFSLKPGRITLARLHRTASGEHQLVIGGGNMEAAPRPYGGTCGVVRFDLPAVTVFDRIMRHGLEHHFSITYGDCRAELRAFAHFVGLRTLELTA